MENILNKAAIALSMSVLLLLGSNGLSGPALAFEEFCLASAQNNQAYKDLKRCDLSNASIHGFTMLYSDLRLFNLDGATIESNMQGSDLRGGSFINTDFTRSVLAETNLDEVDLSTANLSEVYSYGVIGQPILPSGWRLIKGHLLGPKAYVTRSNLSGQNLAGMDLGGANLARTNFSGANLRGVNFEDATLVGVNFTGADLTGANLSNSKLRETSVEGAVFSETNLTGVTSGEITGNPQSTPPYSGIVNGYWVFPGANLTDANFSGANLDNINFSNTNLTGANFSEATLIETIFTDSTLTGANFVDSTFKPRSIEGVISGEVTGFKGNHSSCWRTCLFYNGYLVAPRTNLAKANLDGISVHSNGGSIFEANLTEASLVGANLSGLNLGGVNLSSANLTDATLIGAVVWGSASFDKTNLTRADLSGLNSLGETIDLSAAILNEVKSGSIRGTLTLPGKWKHSKGYLIGPKANLAGANLSQSDLSNANLANANLANANLQEANLAGADLRDAILNGTFGEKISGEPLGLPPGWVLSERSLLQLFLDTPTPSISGVATVGSTLTANVGAWGGSATISYKWLSSSKVVGTGKSYTLVRADLGQSMTVQIQASQRGYVDALKTSSSVIIKEGPFTKAKAPQISGVAIVGRTLKCITTGWVSGAKITYQWYLDGKKIKSAIGSTFKPLPTHKKHRLAVVVTQSSSGYLTKSLSSKLITVGAVQ